MAFVGGSGCDRAQSRAVTARARNARPKWESIPVFLKLNRRWLRVAHGRARKLSGVWTQIEDLGGRLSNSGSRSGHIRDGANATRVISGENGASCTGSGNPAAQQAAQADEQQPPVQLRSDAGSTPGFLPLRLLQRCRGRRAIGFLRCGVALTAVTERRPGAGGRYGHGQQRARTKARSRRSRLPEFASSVASSCTAIVAG